MLRDKKCITDAWIIKQLVFTVHVRAVFFKVVNPELFVSGYCVSIIYIMISNEEIKNTYKNEKLWVSRYTFFVLDKESCKKQVTSVQYCPMGA